MFPSHPSPHPISFLLVFVLTVFFLPLPRYSTTPLHRLPRFNFTKVTLIPFQSFLWNLWFRFKEIPLLLAWFGSLPFHTSISLTAHSYNGFPFHLHTYVRYKQQAERAHGLSVRSVLVLYYRFVIVPHSLSPSPSRSPRDKQSTSEIVSLPFAPLFHQPLHLYDLRIEIVFFVRSLSQISLRFIRIVHFRCVFVCRFVQ